MGLQRFCVVTIDHVFDGINGVHALYWAPILDAILVHLQQYPHPPQLAIRNTLGGPDTQFLIFRDSENGFPR